MAITKQWVRDTIRKIVSREVEQFDGLQREIRFLEDRVETLENEYYTLAGVTAILMGYHGNGGGGETPTGVDEFPHLNELIWGPDSWHGPHPRTQDPEALIANARFDDTGRISWEWTDQPNWPVSDPNIQGNCAIIAQQDGQWYGATWEWFREGQTSKFVDMGEYGDHIKQGGLADWEPAPGDEVYLFLTSHQRAGQAGGPHYNGKRTNIVRIAWD